MDGNDNLNMRVAEEIRALLARRRVTGRELARRLNVSSPWVSQRLIGATEIGLNDLERIAQALDVSWASLLPGAGHRADAEANAASHRMGHNASYALAANQPTARATSTVRRPTNTRPESGSREANARTAGIGTRRPAILSAPSTGGAA